MTNEVLSERAKHRLKLAAGLLRGENKGKGRKPAPLPFSRETFYLDIVKFISELPVEKRDHLKSLVDWAEAYDLEYKKLDAILPKNRSTTKHLES